MYDACSNGIKQFSLLSLCFANYMKKQNKKLTKQCSLSSLI